MKSKEDNALINSPPPPPRFWLTLFSLRPPDYNPSLCEQAYWRVHRAGFNIRGGGANHHAIRTGTFSAFRSFFHIYTLTCAVVYIPYVYDLSLNFCSWYELFSMAYFQCAMFSRLAATTRVLFLLKHKSWIRVRNPFGKSCSLNPNRIHNVPNIRCYPSQNCTANMGKVFSGKNLLKPYKNKMFNCSLWIFFLLRLNNKHALKGSGAIARWYCRSNM